MAAHRTRLCASVTLFIRIFGVIVWRPEYLTSPAQAVKEYCQRNPVFLFTAGRSEPVWVVAIQNTSPLSQVFVSPGPRERALSEAGFRAISPAFEQPVLASDRPRRLEAPPRFGLTVGIVFKAKEELVPLEAQIALTDDLIDEIVYRLYGLTQEEIELVNRTRANEAEG